MIYKPNWGRLPNNWHRDYSVGHEGLPSLKSGLIKCTGSSGIYRNITGPAEIRFWWKSDVTPRQGGSLSFVVNGIRIYECNSDNWSEVAYTTNDIEQEIGWVFNKNKCYPLNKGLGWIDDLCITYENRSILSSQRSPPISPSDIIYQNAEYVISANKIELKTDKLELVPSDVSINTSKIVIDTSEAVIPPINVSPLNPQIEVNVTVNPFFSDNTGFNYNNFGFCIKKLAVSSLWAHHPGRRLSV